MKPYKKFILLFTACSLLQIFSFLPPVVAEDKSPGQTASTRKKIIYKEQILKRMEQKYGGKDFSTVYHQTSVLKALDIAETASGKAYFSHPGKMRWEYVKPERHEIISDGENLWIYRPDENQVLKGSAAAFFKTGAGGSFLSDITQVRNDYEITIKDENETFVNLTLIPKKEIPDITSIIIKILKSSDDIKQVITYNLYGDTTTLDFTEIKFSPLDQDIFKFEIPEGTDLLYME